MKVKMPKPLSIRKMDELMEWIQDECRNSVASKQCSQFKDCKKCSLPQMMDNARWCKRRLETFEHLYHAYATFRNLIPKIEYLIHDKLPETEYEYTDGEL